jgi:hypothetical protein
MWYWVLNLVIAIWVFSDARSRKVDNPIGWSLGCVLLMIVFLPYYFAKRNLKPGEVREGGTAWNVLKSFSLFWTLMMGVAGIAAIFAAGKVVNSASSGAEQTGAAIGTMLGMGMIGTLWFVILLAALVLGMFLKKSSIVEQGPTGALASDHPETITAWK